MGLDRIVQVIDNGSDAPATILPDCSQDLRDRLAAADLIIAKGQGNDESLSDEPGHSLFYSSRNVARSLSLSASPSALRCCSSLPVRQPQGTH